MSKPVPITDHRLPNGLRIVIAPDFRVPVVGLAMTYTVGSANEAPGRTGFAHLFEHMMFQGSAHVAKSEHVTALESRGGDVDGMTYWDSTVYTDVVPSHELPLALWLEADRMATLNQAISQETLDNQREVVKNERQGAIDNVPYGGAEDELFALAFGAGHPYSHPINGLMEDLDSATVTDVRSFFETYYVPNNAVLTIVGDVEPDAALALVDGYFGSIPEAAPAPPVVAPPSGQGQRRRTIRNDVPTAKLFLGCLIPPFGTDEWLTADFTAEVLATGAASRLQARLVRELRLADDVQAAAYTLTAGHALLEVDVEAAEDIEPDDVEAALSAELDRLASQPPTDDELDRIRLQRETTLAINMEQAVERAEHIARYAAALGEPERFGQEAARDREISPERVAALAAGPLSEANRVALWYLPGGD